MEKLFLDFLNRGIAGGWVILAILVLRQLLKKMPKWISCLLWGVAAFRLACPFTLESVFSLIPSRETFRPDIGISAVPAIDSGVRLVDQAVNPVLRSSFAPRPQESANPLQTVLFLAGILWVAVAAALLLYALVSSLRLGWKIRTAVRLQESVYISEFVETPFLFGIFRPRIYLPAGLREELKGPVAAHELAHLKRRDNLWKICGYLLLSVYWFQPLCWVAFILFCRDIELACDEKVIRYYDPGQKKAYSEALLECSMDRHLSMACPLAFGEVGVKERIKSVLHYKKPALWVVAAGVAACIAAAVCFLTDPVKSEGNDGRTLPSDAGKEAGDGSVLGEREADSGEGNSTPGSEEGSGGEFGMRESGEAGSGLPDGREESGGAGETVDMALLEELVREWSRAFVSRDGDTIAGLASKELAGELVSGPAGERSFGVSSPWPADAERDVLIQSVSPESAAIYYYAWTSDPHVAVWKEILSLEQQDGIWVVTGEELIYLDDISTREEYGLAYGYYTIDNTSMNYETNGAGESLNQNALLSSGMLYRGLFEPESAAVELLNLSDDASKVKVERLSEENGAVCLGITFLEDRESVQVSMVQPYGESGIWIPKDFVPDLMTRLMKLDWDAVRSRNLTVRDEPDWSDIIRIVAIPEKHI